MAGGAAVACGVVLTIVGAGSSVLGLVAYTFAAFVLAAIVLEFARGTRARKGLGESSWPAAFTSLVARNRRRYGGYIVHASIALLMIGAVGIGAFGTESIRKLGPGESMRAGDYTLTYAGSTTERVANRTELRAQIDVSRDGDDLGRIAAGKNRYLEGDQPVSNEVAIRTDWPRAEDLFVIADRFNDDGTVWLKALTNPLVNLIWIGGIVFLVGSLVAMWPDAREQRRLARRFAMAPPPRGLIGN